MVSGVCTVFLGGHLHLERAGQCSHGLFFGVVLNSLRSTGARELLERTDEKVFASGIVGSLDKLETALTRYYSDY